jgi:hypothetical protein
VPSAGHFTFGFVRPGRFRELESTTMELPNDILYKIFKDAKIQINEISKDIRNLMLPEITRNLLANIRKIDSPYVIRISRQYETNNGNYRYYSVGKYGEGELTNFCYCNLDGSETIIDSNYEPFYVTTYHVHTDPVVLLNEINSSLLLAVTTEQIAKAIENRTNKDTGFRLALAIARAWSLGKDMSFIHNKQIKEIIKQLS